MGGGSGVVSERGSDGTNSLGGNINGNGNGNGNGSGSGSGNHNSTSSGNSNEGGEEEGGAWHESLATSAMTYLSMAQSWGKATVGGT